MTPTEAATILRQFNEWRRGDEDIPQFDPREIGEAIDAAIAMIYRLEAAESDALEQARLNGMGASREASLMAKLEAAEKSDAESIAMYRKARDERDELRAKIEAMEKQEPYCWTSAPPTGHFCRYKSEVERWVSNGWNVVPLYLAPGAKGE